MIVIKIINIIIISNIHIINEIMNNKINNIINIAIDV